MVGYRGIKRVTFIMEQIMKNIRKRIRAMRTMSNWYFISNREKKPVVKTKDHDTSFCDACECDPCDCGWGN